MLARRMLVILAVLLGLTALAAGIAPPRPVVREGGARTTPSPTAPAEAMASRTFERTISADVGEDRQRIVARTGDTLVLTVESSGIDSVRIGDLATRAVEPDSPARFELLADDPGSHPIELLESDRRIGTLEVRDPR